MYIPARGPRQVSALENRRKILLRLQNLAAIRGLNGTSVPRVDLREGVHLFLGYRCMTPQNVPNDSLGARRRCQRTLEAEVTALAGKQITHLNRDGGHVPRLLFLGWNVFPQRIDQRVRGASFKEDGDDRKVSLAVGVDKVSNKRKAPAPSVPTFLRQV